MKNISLLGASGSIGTQTLDVLRSHPDQFRLVAFSVGKNIDYAVKSFKNFLRKLSLCKERKMF